MGKYEEALERAKAGKPIDEVFPELKESEDERIRKMLISLVKHHADILERQHEEDMLAYLKKQKEQNLEDIEDEAVRKYMKLDRFALANMLAERDKINTEAFENIEKQPAEWSEEDEAKKERLISIVKRALHGNEYPILNDNGATELITWLKSLRPRPHWKPSEEQMEEFRKIIMPYERDRGGRIIYSLYDQLKAL